MDSSDDNLSYVSASDSEVDNVSFGGTTACISSPSEGSQRAYSPAFSVSSRTSIRRLVPKRPAPQPPTRVSSKELVLVTTSPSIENNKPMTSFVQQFHKNSDNVTTKNIGLSGIANHPIKLMPSESRETFQSAKPPQSLDEQSFNVFNGSSGYSNFQIRLIDDVLEPTSPLLPSASVLPSSILHQAHHPRGNLSYSQYPTVYSGFLSQTLTSNVDTPMYLASVSTSNPLPPMYLTSVSASDPLTSNLSAMPPYVTQAQMMSMTPLPIMPQDSSSQLSTLFPQRIHTKNSRFVGETQRIGPNELCHSASDPGVNRLRTSISLSPPVSCLNRLSEEEDDDDEDNDDQDTDEVFESYNQEVRHVQPSKFKKRRRVQRVESCVNVAHLYEDLLISPRFKLKVTLTNLTVTVILAAFFIPNSSAILFSAFRLVFGTLFPAYYSYKAVRTKNVKEYVKWMMYWIVFAFFTCAETITDVFVSFWFPFYYEIKILVVLWLLSPATRGSSILYRKFVHPWLTRREDEIDECIAKAKQQGYSTVVQLGTKGVNYATNVIMQTAIKVSGGGGLVSQLKRSYSASEINEDTADLNRNVKALPSQEHQSPTEEDDRSISSGSYDSEPRLRAESESSCRVRGQSAGRATRTAKTRSADVSEVYFHDSTDTVTQRRSTRSHDTGRFQPTQLYHEQQQRGPVLRRGKYKQGGRPKSLTIGGTAASREAWIRSQERCSSKYYDIPESLSVIHDHHESVPAYATLRRSFKKL